ncbi:MAG TPA: ATP-binding protein [Polyangiaceae bacterium]|nr:ATP-binding protein [Polyangiaceae bacterium]
MQRGSRTRKTGGVGLGLTLMRRIVTAHGGSVEVESRVGHGTAMHVHLPDALVVASTHGTDHAHLGLRRASWAHTALDG